MPYAPEIRHTLPPKSRSGLKGVIYFPFCSQKPWKAYGRQHGQYVTIGYYPTKEEAGRQYNKWALRVYGPDTFLNPL